MELAVLVQTVCVAVGLAGIVAALVTVRKGVAMLRANEEFLTRFNDIANAERVDEVVEARREMLPRLEGPLRVPTSWEDELAVETSGRFASPVPGEGRLRRWRVDGDGFGDN